jgi:hypothetical protein
VFRDSVGPKAFLDPAASTISPKCPLMQSSVSFVPVVESSTNQTLCLLASQIKAVAPGKRLPARTSALARSSGVQKFDKQLTQP